ncbi:unnamed protein product, partial [Rhizoctonia solani]
LEDDVTRNILLDRTYDFTDTEGTVTGPGCKPWSCSPNPQLSLDGNGWCGSNPVITATYKKAGTSGIRVKSNKTILGKGTSGWIKGKGLLLSGVSNVIIQNIRISDLNPQYVWGGDALYIDNSSKIWASSQMSYRESYLTQTRDDPSRLIITMASVQQSRSRSLTTILMVNLPGLPGQLDAMNTTIGLCYSPAMGTKSPLLETTYIIPLAVAPIYFNDITGHAIDADVGTKLLAEGNYFNNVKTPSTGNTNGAVFAPTSSSMNSQCSGTLGRNCVSNTLSGSGSLTNTANSGAISAFTASVVKSASIMDPGAVASYVLANAGLGKVN